MAEEGGNQDDDCHQDGNHDQIVGDVNDGFLKMAFFFPLGFGH